MKKIISIFCLSLVCMIASAKHSQEQIEFVMNVSSAVYNDGFVDGYSYNRNYYRDNQNGWLNVFDRSCFIEGGLLSEEENNDDKNTTIVIKTSDMLFTEDFSDLSKGNSKDTNSSSTPWNGNDNFPNVEYAYQAGGAVKLGAGSKAGSMTSSIIDCKGGNVVVEVDVKGWTSVEGKLLLSMTGSDTLEVPYKATMSDKFETVQVLLTGVSALPSLTIQTSKKRCFIDEVRVYGNRTDTVFNYNLICYKVLSNKDKTVAVTSKSDSYSGNIVIPSTVKHEGVEYSVTSIGNAAFYKCSGLTSITIPNSVTSIGTIAFYDCIYEA